MLRGDGREIRKPLLPVTQRKYTGETSDEEETPEKKKLSLPTMNKRARLYPVSPFGEKRSRPRRHKARRPARSSSAGDELRVSVYCVGDTVNCPKLLSRLESEKVKRLPGRWIDALWENAVHSYLEDDEFDDDDMRSPRFRRRRSSDSPQRFQSPRSALRAELLVGKRRVTTTDDDDHDLAAPGAAARRRREDEEEAELRQEAEEYSADDWHDEAKLKNPPKKTKHVFAFSFGCVVVWGFEKAEERAIVSGLLADTIAVVSGATSAAERVEAHDTMAYVVDYDTLRGAANCKNDVIRLSSDDPLEKFSLAYAMAQSAKLFIWEARVDVTIKEVKHIPERLAATGRTDLTEKQISQMIGKVFIERTQVNLHSDILDSPDFLWEDDHHEPTYNDLKVHLDVPERVALLNDRLDILKELLEVLNTQLSNHHSSRLEIIVIWLIVAEIIVSILSFLADRVLPPVWVRH